MADHPPCILQVSTTDGGGGAQKVARELLRACLARGFQAWLAAGYRRGDGPNVLSIPNDDLRGEWARRWIAAGNRLSPLVGRVRGAGRLRDWICWLGQPKRWWEFMCGHEDFAFPGTWRLLALPPEPPELIHCHNLHGDYFDLRALVWLSENVPVVLTLHDAWLLSGHCAHPLDCDRWKTGCGRCPDLTIYPPIRRDATAFNWRRKRAIFAKSRLRIATPSRWLMEKVEQSILAPAILERRVIPHGVDVEVFCPADRQSARASLDLPQAARLLLFSGNTIRHNPWKDYATLRNSLRIIAQRSAHQQVLLVVLGGQAPAEHVGGAEVRFVPFQTDPRIVSRYYQAADVYVHAAHVDTFPNAVMEALACGTPVVATAVGGIPEQVRSLEDRLGQPGQTAAAAEDATGILVRPQDAEAMAEAVLILLRHDEIRSRLGENAAQDAVRRFGLERVIDSYLGWYAEILERSVVNASGHEGRDRQ